eukprot:Gb_22240 [translate_table: standard]
MAMKKEKIVASLSQPAIHGFEKWTKVLIIEVNPQKPGHIEEKIYQRQVMKGEVAAAIEGLGETGFGHRKGSQHFSREELRELFTLRLDTRCDTYDLLSRSNLPSLEDWKDHSENVEDSALKHAIQSGIITFVHRITKSLIEDSD